MRYSGVAAPFLQVGPDKTEFKIEGLTPRKKYKFRVRAVNKEGESEPLETDEAIEARNPYGKGGEQLRLLFRIQDLVGGSLAESVVCEAYSPLVKLVTCAVMLVFFYALHVCM